MTIEPSLHESMENAMHHDPQTHPFHVIGVDIGGGKIALGAVSSAGEVTASQQYPTGPERPAEAVIDDLTARIRKMTEEVPFEVDGLGVGVCGQVVMSSGVVRQSPNLPNWDDVPLRQRLEAALGLPVTVANDMKVIALGQWQYSSERAVDDLVVVFVGTGVGGGVIANGQMLLGRDDHAGEVGHATIMVDGRECRCGNLGCLEAYVGGWAIAERAREAAEGDPREGAKLLALAGGNLENITAETVADANREDDDLARRIVEETGHYLGAGMVGVVNGFNPSRLILGGGVLDGIPELLESVEAHVQRYALRACTTDLEVILAEFGAEAGILGGAALAMQTLPNARSRSGELDA